MFGVIKKAYLLATPEERKVVLGNVLSLSTLQGVNYVLPLVVMPYLIRVIGLEKFGLLAFAQAFVQYFLILTDYGFNYSATREISLHRENQNKVSLIFSAVTAAKLLLLLICIILLGLILNFIPRFKNDWQVFVFSFGVVVANTVFPVWFYQGMEKMRYISVLNIIGGIVYALGIFLSVKSPADYLYVPLLQSLIFLAVGIAGFSLAFVKFKVKFTFRILGGMLRELRAGWQIFVSIVAINAYTNTRIFAVGLLTNNILTGYYSIAEKIAYVIQTFPLASFSQAIYPRLSKIFLKSRGRALKLMHKIQNSTVYIALIALPVIFILAPWIVKIICGAKYQPAISALRLLLVAVLFINANAFRVQFLLVAGRMDLYSKIHVIIAAAGLPLIFVLVYYLSYLGAAFSTIITELGILLLTLNTLEALSFNEK